MNLRDYDYVVINSSAGKDSLASLDYVVDLARAQAVMDRLLVVHCDLGRVEWQGTRELAERQAARYGLRFEVVSRPQGDLLEHIEARGKFPDSGNRYCTSDHKRGQVAKLLTQLAREKGAHVRILNVMGIRADESRERGKKAAFSRDERASNGRRTVDTWFPIFTWTVEQVWERINSRGLEAHPAYALGMRRLSCCFCVLATRQDLVIAGRHNRELLDAYVAVEDRIGHRFNAKFSLREVRAEACQVSA